MIHNENLTNYKINNIHYNKRGKEVPGHFIGNFVIYGHTVTTKAPRFCKWWIASFYRWCEYIILLLLSLL